MQPQAPAAGNGNLFNMLGSGPTPAARPPSYAAPMQNPMGTGMGMGMGMGMMKPMATSPPPMMGAPLVPNQGVMSPMSPPSRTTTTSPGAGAGAQPKASANFDDLKPTAGGVGAQKSVKDLEKEKAQGYRVHRGHSGGRRLRGEYDMPLTRNLVCAV